MSRFRDVLYSYLSSYAGLTALVENKIYPADRIPQGTVAPYIPHKEVSRERLMTHQGPAGASIYSQQISVYAATDDAAGVIADQVLAAVEAWPAADSKMGYAHLDNETDATWVEELSLYCIDMDFEIFYED